MFERDPDYHAALHQRVMREAPPGPVFEFGVGHGASLITWAAERYVYGFDTFTGFPAEDILPEDKAPDWTEKQQVYVGLKPEAIGLRHVMLVPGKVQDTLDRFIAEIGATAAIVNLDLDLYLPTKFVLDRLYSITRPGSVIISDQYHLPEFVGERKAVDEFLRDRSDFSAVSREGYAGVFRRIT